MTISLVYLYPKPVDFRKSIDGLAALVELDIKVAVFDPVLFVFLNRPRNRVKILYWERNGFCLWLKRLESERFKTSPDDTDGGPDKLNNRVLLHPDCHLQCHKQGFKEPLKHSGFQKPPSA